MKNRLKVIFGLILFLCAAVIIIKYSVDNKPREKINPAYQTILERTASWRKLLAQKMQQGKLDPADFEKLDFSRPTEADIGTDLRWKFFNQLGPYKAKPLPSRMMFLDMTDTPKIQVTFNLRRDRKNNEEIYAILTDGSLFCPILGEKFKNPVVISNVEIARDNKTIVQDEKEIIGCILDQHKKPYLFIPIAKRVMSSHGKWHFVP